MKNQGQRLLITLSLVSVIFFNSLTFSEAEQCELISNILGIHDLPNKTQLWMTKKTQNSFQETHQRFSPAMAIAGFLCFLAACISSAGGIGGGGLFIPILKIVGGLDLRAATSFSAFMVTGGSVANVICYLFIKSSKFGSKCLIDYDIALLSEPCMLLGVSIGVICNLVFPEWLITILFAVFLAWSTFKTCSCGIRLWKQESEERTGIAEPQECEHGIEGGDSGEVPLLGMQEGCEERFPWMNVVVLFVVWFSFFLVYLLRGNRYGQSIIPMEPCGPGYWILTSIQIPLALAFTSWTILGKESFQGHSLQGSSGSGPTNRLIFPVMALIAGVLGGLFGIGGGMLISPLLLQVGIAPEVTAATCSFMVLFSATMSALQYVLLGMDSIEIALAFSVICFVASNIGTIVVQRAIQQSGRASLIVLSVGIVMALSTVLITSYGSVDVWNEYVSGKYMGFKHPC